MRLGGAVCADFGRPLIQNVPLSQLQRVTGLSLRCVSLIRRGERMPHLRHWQALLGSAVASEAVGSRRSANLV